MILKSKLSDLSGVLSQASTLTKSGRLSEATTFIRRALGGMPNQDSRDPSPAAAPGATPRGLSPRWLRAFGELQERAAAIPDLLHSPGLRPRPARSPQPASGRREDGIDAPANGRFVEGRFQHGSQSLRYKLFVPAARDLRGAPLVVMLHGCTQNADDFAAGTQMNALAAERGALVLYPEQATQANFNRCWNWFEPQHQGRDRGETAVIAALTRSVIAEHAIDPAKVFAAGLSAGGAMAALLGQQFPDVFAAVAVHSGLPAGAAHDMSTAFAAMQSGSAEAPAAATASSAPTMPPARTIIFHGTRDDTVNPRNAEQVIASVLQSRGPIDVQVSERPAAADVAGGRAATVRRYRNADGETLVEQWTIHGSGHAWSGGSAEGSYTDPAGPSASEAALRFFLDHPSRRGH